MQDLLQIHKKIVKLKNQLYDLKSPSRPRLVRRRHEIVKLTRVKTVRRYRVHFDATQLYDFVCFVSRAWAGVQKANHKVDRLVPWFA